MADGSLSARQEQFILALLAHPSVAEACKACHIAERTAYNWLKNDAFKAAHRTARHEAFKETLLVLMSGTSTALKVHLDMMKDTKAPHTVRLQAAKTWLELAIQVHRNDEVDRRLAALEERQGIG